MFFAGAGVVLLMLVVSGSMRRRLRVFLNKHFYRNKYDYRVEWLRFIQTLSVPEEGVDTRDNAVRAMAQIINSPGGVLFLRIGRNGRVRGGRVVAARTNSRNRVAMPLLPATDEMVSFLQRFQWVIDLDEMRITPDCLPEHRAAGVPAGLATLPARRAAGARG